MGDVGPDTVTEWRRESRYYRQSPGWGWLLGLLLIPLLFGWLGWSAAKPNAAAGVPSATGSAPNPPGVSDMVSAAPLSIVRNGKDFTLTGELPDLSVKDKLLEVLKSTLGPGVNLIDNLTVKAGVRAPEVAGVGPVFQAANEIGDFSFNLTGDALTLAGTAPSEQVKSGVEAASKAAWANVRTINNIEVTAASTDAGSCSGLQADIASALRNPIAYQTGGSSLTAASKTELNAVAAVIKACPQAKVTVIGHTDNIGGAEVNVALSKNRARSVADYLVSQGVPAGSVTAEGAGSSRPVAGNDTPDGRAQNRRTEIIVE